MNLTNAVLRKQLSQQRQQAKCRELELSKFISAQRNATLVELIVSLTPQ